MKKNAEYHVRRGMLVGFLSLINGLSIPFFASQVMAAGIGYESRRPEQPKRSIHGLPHVKPSSGIKIESEEFKSIFQASFENIMKLTGSRIYLNAAAKGKAKLEIILSHIINLFGDNKEAADNFATMLSDLQGDTLSQGYLISDIFDGLTGNIFSLEDISLLKENMERLNRIDLRTFQYFAHFWFPQSMISLGRFQRDPNSKLSRELAMEIIQQRVSGNDISEEDALNTYDVVGVQAALFLSRYKGDDPKRDDLLRKLIEKSPLEVSSGNFKEHQKLDRILNFVRVELEAFKEGWQRGVKTPLSTKFIKYFLETSADQKFFEYIIEKFDLSFLESLRTVVIDALKVERNQDLQAKLVVKYPTFFSDKKVK